MMPLVVSNQVETNQVETNKFYISLHKNKEMNHVGDKYKINWSY